MISSAQRSNVGLHPSVARRALGNAVRVEGYWIVVEDVAELLGVDHLGVGLVKLVFARLPFGLFFQAGVRVRFVNGVLVTVVGSRVSSGVVGGLGIVGVFVLG